MQNGLTYSLQLKDILLYKKRMLAIMVMYTYLGIVNGVNMGTVSSDSSGEVFSNTLHSVTDLISFLFLDSYLILIYIYTDLHKFFYGGNYKSQSVDGRDLLC